MNYSTAEIWVIIVLMGIGTYLIRFSFLGPLGRWQMPPWALRLLRYTPVAVLPGLVAPLVLWPAATEGVPDPARMLAAGTTLLVGYFTKNVVASILSGAGVLYLLSYFLG